MTMIMIKEKLNNLLQTMTIRKFSSTKEQVKINTESKQKKTHYYNFYCKCEFAKEFSKFTEFIGHIKDSHNIKDINISEIIAEYNNCKRSIKFYWGLKCKCGHDFTSSLCNADLTVKNKKIVLSKLYNLECKKCHKPAKFKEKELLNKFLEERVIQKLIYKYYEEEFSKYNNNIDRDKKLEGHIRHLCEKCKLSLTGYCGDDIPL